MVLVQDPVSAKFDSMPRSAMDAVMIDIVAPANELPSKLIAALKLPSRSTARQELEKDTSALEKIIILLRLQTGNDFSEYKKNTVYRRIERRMGIHQIDKIATYVRYLQENPAEGEILFKELLIGVTGFFRDAYSLAIVFKEAIEKINPGNNITLQIFATDLDSVAIEKARKGMYPANIVSDMSAARLSRYFIKSDDQYRVNAQIREMVVFAPQNVIKDPPFTKLDIISCRNLLIYLDSDLQKKLLALFDYSLNLKGILLLGSAETNGSQTDLFSVIDSKLRIYQRSGALKTDDLFDFPSAFTHSRPGITESQKPANVTENLQNLTDQLLLQQFSPASVLVTSQGDILYITGSTGKYLEPAAGKANMNLFAMARGGLRNELPAAFRKVVQNFDKVFLQNLNIIADGRTSFVNVTIQQIENPMQLRGKILVIFSDLPEKEFMPSKSGKGKMKHPAAQDGLELELQSLKELLQSTREEMQTSQEELKSTNEELQSTNEELQSTNEELTTSKEEMQSLNEELHTVNVELQSKIEDAARVNNDMNNLLNSIEVATLFLDKELKIRQFTDPATKIFKLIKSDIGRLFTDQVTELVYPEMFADAHAVLKTLVYAEKIISTRDGRWFTVRIMPYRTFDDKIDGLVITFIEITKSKQLEIRLRETQNMLRSLVDAVPDVVMGLTDEGIIVEFNPEAEKLLGFKREQVIGKKYVDFFIPEVSRKKVGIEMKKLLEGEIPNKFINNVKAANGSMLKIEWTAHKLFNEDGPSSGLITIGLRISED